MAELPTRLHVLIAGGGIGGLAAALCLAKAGLKTSVFEQAPTFTETGAGIQLSPNCSRILHYLGLAASLGNVACLPEATRFRHWQSGRIISETPLGDTALARYGAPYYHIHRGDLMQILLDAASQEDAISLHPGSRVSAFSQDAGKVSVTLDQSTCEGDVLIGADGIHSQVRSILRGDRQPRFTGNIAWRALVPSDKLPHGLIKPVSTVWWGPGAHFVHYYVRRGELVNCVCVVEKDGWEVESWTERGELAELKADFAGWHPDILQVIDAVDTDSLFKWALFDRPPMKSWSEGRVTLLGDACHPTLPFMAQGAAMAIEDAAVLAGVLARGNEVEASLKQYESLRQQRTALVQRGSRRNARVFHLTGIKAWFRNLAAGTAGNRTMETLYGYNALDAADVTAG